MALAAIIPLIPLAMKLLDIGTEARNSDNDTSKEVLSALKKSTGKTELVQSSYVYAIYSIVQTISGCNEIFSFSSLSCVSVDQWVLLSGCLSAAYVTLSAKLKEGK
jgi:hypothetical protein